MKVRVQLSLEECDARLLRMVAAMRGTSMSQLVMEAVAEITDVSMLEEWSRAESKRGEPGDWELMAREQEYRNRELLSES